MLQQLSMNLKIRSINISIIIYLRVCMMIEGLLMSIINMNGMDLKVNLLFLTLLMLCLLMCKRLELLWNIKQASKIIQAGLAKTGLLL